MLQPGYPAAQPEHALQGSTLARAPDVGLLIRPDFPQPVDKLRVYVRLGDDAQSPWLYFVD